MLKVNIAAYCRVSTDKSDQLNSLEAQKKFFAEFTERNGHNLVRLYADEGISGTKIKNRKEFQRLMRDAKQGLFEMVVVKDISRFARNTVDFLQIIRALKSLGIETTFLTANMTVLGNSEFVLTIFGALAQEESANTSKRVKFGKKLNAEKGRVPNIVYGYDKTIGDYFNLEINKEEARIVRQIYKWYINEGYGAAKIANMLNEQGIKTKRNCAWSQNAICRILTNELYMGKIINGKEEVEDFLTGVRTTKDESEWLITDKPELRIIEPEIFDKAQEVLRGRHKAFKLNKERQSNKYIFSTLIKCKECGWSFRRTVRTYKNTYIRWVCSGHNGKGADNCPNAVTIDEAELIQALDEYFKEILKDKKNIINRIVREFNRIYKKKEDNEQYENELITELARLKKTREKYMDMYTDDLISREELNEKIGGMKKKIEKLENELKLVEYNLNKGDQLEEIVQHTFKNIEGITSVADMTNEQLKQIIQKIEVDKEGNVDIYLRIFGDLGLDDSVLISYDYTHSSFNVSEEENAMTISDFQKDTSLTSIPESNGKLLNLDLESVIAYGRLRALFGEPNYETQNSEDAYSYILFVEPESSEKIYLEVYEGSSGPAIGGLNNAESLQAAETLKKLIEESEEVADYQYEGYYQDLDLKISMGIKNGVPYYNEEPCEEIPDFQ